MVQVRRVIGRWEVSGTVMKRACDWLRRCLYGLGSLGLLLHVAWAAEGLRASWPDPLTSYPGFNAASRAEILTFGSELLASEMLPADEWPGRLHVTLLDMPAFEQYRQLLWRRLLTAYRAAARDCGRCAHPETVAALREVVARQPPVSARFAAWQQASHIFHAAYLQQLLVRAAAAQWMPNEAQPLTPDELTGFELLDGEFLLSFDGGPTAIAQTQRLAQLLNDRGQNAVFFTIGERLLTRAHGEGGNLHNLYAENCVATQGMQERVMRGREDWLDTLEQGRRSLLRVNGSTRLPWFRPPQGERDLDISTRAPLRLVLWNIDSGDLRRGATATQVSDRVLTLMLLWRRGVIRFHDRSPLALQVLPGLFTQVQTSPVRWVDCRTFADH